MVNLGSRASSMLPSIWCLYILISIGVGSNSILGGGGGGGANVIYNAIAAICTACMIINKS